jgi:HlyD family type I secretion membrane fusion protein
MMEDRAASERAKAQDRPPARTRRRRPWLYLTVTIYGVGLAIAAGIGWMSVNKVEMVATAPGIVRLMAKALPVSHPLGGRATRVAVKEGAEVKAGDRLIDLKNEEVEQGIVRDRASYFALTAEIARLEGEIVEEPPRYPPEIASDPVRLAESIALYRAHQAQIASRRVATEQELELARGQIADLTPQVKTLGDQVPLLERRARDLGTLAKQGYYSEAQQTEARQQLVDAQAKYAQAQRQLKQAEQALADATERQNQMERAWNAGNRKRLADARLERDRVQLALAQQGQITTTLVIRAPIDGIVDGLKITSAGEIVPAGEPIAGIIPLADARKIELEVHVPGADIGGIKPGARAVVKLEPFDWTRYGTLVGTVREVAGKPVGDTIPTVTDSSRAAGPQPYFLVMVTLEKDYVGENTKDRLVRRGMTATVDFPLGRRTVLDDLTDRYIRIIRERLREP